MKTSKIKWIGLAVLLSFMFAVTSANMKPTLADDTEGIAWRGKFVPCNPQLCGSAEQNVGTLSVKSSGVVVQSNGLVKIKLRRLATVQGNAVLANKTLDVFIGNWFQGVFQSYQGPGYPIRYGTITTDGKGNFEGTDRYG